VLLKEVSDVNVLVKEGSDVNVLVKEGSDDNVLVKEGSDDNFSQRLLVLISHTTVQKEARGGAVA
jgi:hypothetical protein